MGTSDATALARAATSALWVLAAIAIQPARAAGPPGGPLPHPDEMERCYRQIREGQFDAARARLTPIVAHHPDWQRATFFLALTFHEEQRYAEARPLFARALALDPSSPDVPAIRLHHGWALYYLGELDAAQEQMTAFVKLRPDHPDGPFALGLIDFDADAVESASARFRRAIELSQAAKDPRSEGKARARLADVHVRLGDLAAAKHELETAVRLRPDAYEAYFKLSRVLERLGDAEGAAAALAKHHEVRERLRPTAPPM